MDAMSVAEALLHGMAEESGVVPEGGLLERLEKSPPGALRRLGRLDAEMIEWCGVAPLEVAGILAGLLEEGVGDDGRIVHERAWDAVVAARQGAPLSDPDITATRLLEIAHQALGLGDTCPACAEWEPGEDEATDAEGDHDEGEHEGHEHEHEHDPHTGGPVSLVDRVFDVHAEALDTWEAQVALRLAGDAGEDLAEIAGFDVLHQLVGHSRNVPGLDRARHAEVHTVQHAGMSLCIDAAQVQGLRVAVRALAGEGGVADRYGEAEEQAAEESGVMAAVAASVVVDRAAPRVAEVLDAAPPQALPKGPARNRRRKR